METERLTREFLSAELTRRLQARPGYSLRAFARDLGLSPGELSEILRGKRPLSPKKTARVAERLGLSATETRALLGMGRLEAAGVAGVPLAERALTLDLFHVVSEWYCFAILNLAETKGARLDPRWIAGRLGISPTEAMVALEKLERVGLLSREDDGTLAVDDEFVLAPDGIPSEAIRKYHRAILQKAIAALETQPTDRRDISGLGVALNPRDLPAVRREIREFQQYLAKKYGAAGRKTEVFQLEIALFQLTKSHEGEKR